MTGVWDAASDGGVHASRIEALRKQISMDPPDARCFLERHTVPESPIKGLLDQEIFIEIAEDVRDRRSCHVARDAERFDLAHRPQPSMSLHVRFRSCAGERGAVIVQSTLALQTFDCRVNVVGLELATREASPDLRFAEFAAGEHLEPGQVRAGHDVIVAGWQKSKVTVPRDLCLLTLALRRASTRRLDRRTRWRALSRRGPRHQTS